MFFVLPQSLRFSYSRGIAFSIMRANAVVKLAGVVRLGAVLSAANALLRSEVVSQSSDRREYRIARSVFIC